MRPVVPRHQRLCTKCSHTVVEDEVHLLFECPAYDNIRAKYESARFANFGGYQQAARIMKHNAQKVREFMDQEPSFQLARFVFECMEYRRSDECDDWNPYFDHQLVGDNWQGQVFDTFSSGP